MRACLRTCLPGWLGEWVGGWVGVSVCFCAARHALLIGAFGQSSFAGWADIRQAFHVQLSPPETMGRYSPSGT